ncbi:hypothetical protein BJY52DRAFT_1231954 [Lactarius psammicola]|nr:hypothetical protein BJY52DRAFT_1231954 [Lactarius psammicola]
MRNALWIVAWKGETILQYAAQMVYGFGMLATFNAMQSSCFDMVKRLFDVSGANIMKSEENVVCIFILIENLRTRPKKALCAERTRDWTENRNLWIPGHKVLLTIHQYYYGDVHYAPPPNGTQVHILDELRRSTLEVVVSRVKTRGSTARFVVSATVPNIDDVAHQIANRDSSDAAASLTACLEKQIGARSAFTFVYGFARSKNQNDFSFARLLDRRLFPPPQYHSANKPILIS